MFIVMKGIGIVLIRYRRLNPAQRKSSLRSWRKPLRLLENSLLKLRSLLVWTWRLLEGIRKKIRARRRKRKREKLSSLTGEKSGY